MRHLVDAVTAHVAQAVPSEIRASLAQRLDYADRLTRLAELVAEEEGAEEDMVAPMVALEDGSSLGEAMRRFE